MEYSYSKEIIKTEIIEIKNCVCGNEPNIDNFISGGDGCALRG